MSKGVAVVLGTMLMVAATVGLVGPAGASHEIVIAWERRKHKRHSRKSPPTPTALPAHAQAAGSSGTARTTHLSSDFCAQGAT